jgi:hypothetical protein
MDNRNLLLTVLEAGSPRSKCQQFQCLARARSLLQDGALVLYSHMVERQKEKRGTARLNVFHKIILPFVRAHPHGLIASSRPPPLNTTFMMKVQPKKCEEYMHSNRSRTMSFNSDACLLGFIKILSLCFS